MLKTGPTKDQPIIRLQRIAHWCHRLRIPFIPKLITALIRLTCCCTLPAGAKLGRNVHLSHSGLAAMIHADCIIGDNVSIGTHVLIGGNTKDLGVPTIEDDVIVYPFAMIVGPIRIGKGAVISPQAFVCQDVPPGVTVRGQPAKVVGEARPVDAAMPPLRPFAVAK